MDLFELHSWWSHPKRRASSVRGVRHAGMLRFISYSLFLAGLVLCMPISAASQNSSAESDDLSVLDSVPARPTERIRRAKDIKKDSSDLSETKPLWPSEDEPVPENSEESPKDRLGESPGDKPDSLQQQEIGTEVDNPDDNISLSTESDGEWKLDLAKKDYARAPNDLSLTEVLSAYAELINSDCFKERKASCPRLIEESLRLDPFFTPAICAKHGAESKLCLQSFGSISLGLIEDSKSSISRKLTLNLDESHQAELLKSMQERRWSLMREFNQAQSQKTLSDILMLFFRELALVCNREQFYVESIRKGKEVTPVADDPLTALILATPTPTPIPGGFSRSRRITKACWDIAEEALSFSPDFSSAVCAKFGRYSPKCHTSLKNGLAQKKALDKPSSSTAGDISSEGGQEDINPADSGRSRGNSVGGGLEEF